MSDLDRELNARVVADWPTGFAITAEALSAALNGRRLEPTRDWQWVAEATRGALFVACRSYEENVGRTGKAATAKRLKRKAAKSWALWQELFSLDSEEEDAVWWQAVEESGGPLPDPLGDAPDFRRFRAATAELQWVAGFLDRATNRTKQRVDAPRWTETRWREARISAAICLSEVFEKGFGRSASINSWEGANDRGDWPAFYQAVMQLAFPDRALPDLEGVLDAARTSYLDHGVTFAPGIIPE